MKLTPYPDVSEILNLLLANVKEILQSQFVGMYLYGSLSSGDFNPETSDIDFLVITKDSLPEETIAELEMMHHRIWNNGSKWAPKLEGAYIPRGEIRRYNPDHPRCPVVNEGKFYVGGFGSDWIIQRHVVREMGVVLAGPDPKTLIDPVGPDDIRRAVWNALHEWWFPMLDDPSWLQGHESNYHGYAVITMCRALHALRYGTIVSKPIAIQWAKENLDSRWHPLIEKAVASQYGKRPDILDDTLEFIRFTKSTLDSGSLLPPAWTQAVRLQIEP